MDIKVEKAVSLQQELMSNGMVKTVVISHYDETTSRNTGFVIKLKLKRVAI